MKKILFMIVLLIPTIVLANPNFSNYKNIIQNGDITKEYIENYKKAKVEVTTTFEDINEESFRITFTFNDQVKKEKETEEEPYIPTEIVMLFQINHEKNTIFSEYRYPVIEYGKQTDADKDLIKYSKDVYKLITIWGLESSDEYKRIKAFRESGDDYINFLLPIFEECYMEERGACYTESTVKEEKILQGEIELSDKATKYALKYLEERARDNKQHRIYIYCIIAIVVIGPIYYVMQKNLDREKAKKITNQYQVQNNNKFFK
jgi:hypothetical protein